MHVDMSQAGRALRTRWPPRARSPDAGRAKRTDAQRVCSESAARGLSRYGYGNLILERVANEAGYTRGALYHQFRDKEDLALAVIDWVDETWQQEVGRLVEQEPDPVAALIVMARGHAIFCRRDVARVAIALRLEFSGQDHPVGRHLERVSEGLVKRCTRLIGAGRRAGTIPAGPPARAVALAFIGALEGTVISSPDKHRTMKCWRRAGLRCARARPRTRGSASERNSYATASDSHGVSWTIGIVRFAFAASRRYVT